jgi:hypothetical protein
MRSKERDDDLEAHYEESRCQVPSEACDETPPIRAELQIWLLNMLGYSEEYCKTNVEWCLER